MIHLCKLKLFDRSYSPSSFVPKCCRIFFYSFSNFIVSHAELSPGLAALTVGCDSGNLGSLSRVQLLLLDRLELDTLQSAIGLDEEEFSPMQDWPDFGMNYDRELASAGIVKKGKFNPEFLNRFRRIIMNEPSFFLLKLTPN